MQKTYQQIIKQLQESVQDSFQQNFIAFSHYQQKEGVFNNNILSASLMTPDVERLSIDQENEQTKKLLESIIKQKKFSQINNVLQPILKHHSDEVIKIIETTNVLCQAEFLQCNAKIIEALTQLAMDK